MKGLSEALIHSTWIATFAALTLAACSMPARAELVVHLPFDAGANHSISTSGGSVTTVPGVVGQAVGLRPSRQGTTVENVESRVKLSTSGCIALWFQAADPVRGGLVIISGGGFRVGVNKTSNHAYAIVNGLQCTFQGIAPTKGVNGYTNVCDGQWHHLLAMYDGKALSLYVDGVLEDIVDASGRIKANSGELTLARAPHAPDNFSEPVGCYIDEVRIHDELLDYVAIAQLARVKPSSRALAGHRTLDLRRDFLDREVVPIQAHRGGGMTLPENTIETYLDTWRRGMIPEADMRTTKDGVIICVHDNNPRRVCPDAPEPLRDMAFDQMTLPQARRLDVGKYRGRPGQKIPTLEEVFARMKGHPERMIEMDYKDVSLVDLAALVHQYDLHDQAFFIFRRHHLILQWRQLVPNGVTMLWMGGSEHVLAGRLDQLRRDDFAGISLIEIIMVKDQLAKDGFQPSLDFLQKCRRELQQRDIQLQLIPWKIADQAVFEKLVAAGFRFFGTDYPETALEAFRKVMEKSHAEP